MDGFLGVLPSTSIGIRVKWVFLVIFCCFIIRIIGNFLLIDGFGWLTYLNLTKMPISKGWLHQEKSNIGEIMLILVGYYRYTYKGISVKSIIKLMYWGQIIENC